jgi:protocatechuate 3,4-dioxygenase alpha subunit
MTAGCTPSQTVGPFFANALSWPDGPYVVVPGTPGAVWLRGQVLDGAGEPVPDAVVETWQADPAGRFDHPDDPRGAVPGFRGFGRCGTDPAGWYAIHTVKPGPVPIPLGTGPLGTGPLGTGPLGTGPLGTDAPEISPHATVQAPHVDVSVFARGLLRRVVTRIYFGDEPAANRADPVLRGIPPDRGRDSLIAEPADDGYRFDIRLQGEHETVFFAV